VNAAIIRPVIADDLPGVESTGTSRQRSALRDQGPIRMKKLSVVERVAAPSLTVAIRRLETLGLVKRSRDAADLRLVYVDSHLKALRYSVSRWPTIRPTRPRC
jgi:hypothetical protein